MKTHNVFEFQNCVEISEGGCTLGQGTTGVTQAIQTTTEANGMTPPNTSSPAEEFTTISGVITTVSENDESDLTTLQTNTQPNEPSTENYITSTEILETSTLENIYTTTENIDFTESSTEIHQTTESFENDTTLSPISESTTQIITSSSQNTETAQTTQTSDVTESVPTTTSIGTTTAPICPPGVFGNVPNPERCDAFYFCTGVSAIPLQCAEGYEYDDTVKV